MTRVISGKARKAGFLALRANRLGTEEALLVLRAHAGASIIDGKDNERISLDPRANLQLAVNRLDGIFDQV